MKLSELFSDKFYLVALSILIPTSINLSITQFLTPILNSFMVRATNPELSISVFSITMSILFLISLPHLRVQHLTIVYYKNYSKMKIHFFIFSLAIICLIISIFVIFSPAVNFVLDTIFGTSGDMRINVENALKISFFIPFLLIIKMHFYAISIVSSKSNYIWIGTISGFIFSILFASILFFLNFEKYNLGITSYTLASIIETLIIMLLVRKNLFDSKIIFNKDILRLGELTKFFTPLLFAAFLPSFTMPAINACLTRFENPEVAISSVNLGFGIFGAVTFTINGCQSTILSLLANGYRYKDIRNFSYIVGFITLFICSLISWIPLINNFIFSDLFGISGSLLSGTLIVFKLLSILPPFLVMEQIYVGIIMNSKSTNPLFYINICRFLVLIFCLSTGILFFKSYGPVVGGSAWALTLFFEAIFAWLFARKITLPS